MGTACYGGVSLLNNNYSRDPLNLSIFMRERERDIINSVWNAYHGSSGANDEFVPTRVKLHSKYQWVRRPTRSNPTLREMKMIESCTYYGRGWHFKEQDLVLSSPQPPKPNTYAEDELSWKSRLGQFKQGIDSKKNREHRWKATRQRQKEDRSQLIYKRRGALCIPEPMAVDDDEVSSTTESSSTVPATQGDVVVEFAKPLASLTPISSDLDDDSTIASDSTEDLNKWFPITSPAKPLVLSTPISSDLDDESTIASASTAEMASWFPVEEKVAEPEIPSIVTIIAAEVPSEEESSDSTLPAIIVQEDAGVEAAAPQDDVVFDTAGNESFDIEVDDEVEQVTTVSDAEHESIVLFLAAFTTADVPVEEDEAPAPVAIETPSSMPVIHEDVAVEALAEVAVEVEEPLVLESIIEQSNNAASRAMKELESTLDGHYWASISESRSRRRRTQTNFFSPC